MFISNLQMCGFVGGVLVDRPVHFDTELDPWTASSGGSASTLNQRFASTPTVCSRDSKLCPPAGLPPTFVQCADLKQISIHPDNSGQGTLM